MKVVYQTNVCRSRKRRKLISEIRKDWPLPALRATLPENRGGRALTQSVFLAQSVLVISTAGAPSVSRPTPTPSSQPVLVGPAPNALSATRPRPTTHFP